MQKFAVIAEKRDWQLAEEVVVALTSGGRAKVDLVDLMTFKQNELSYYGNKFLVFIGRNPISLTYIRDMQVHDVHCGVKWGIRPEIAAAVWLDEGHRIAASRLFEALQRENEMTPFRCDAAGIFRNNTSDKIRPGLIQKLITTVSQGFRRRVEYVVGILDFLRDGLPLATG